MDFGQAINELKNGKKVCRSGWNGKNMFIYLEESLRRRPVSMNDIDMIFEPVIVMFTAKRTYQRGWLASQADILADDWEVFEDS